MQLDVPFPACDFFLSIEFNHLLYTTQSIPSCCFVYIHFVGIGCKVAGFLTVFATHLSVFTLTLITIERWYAITHAIHLNKRIKIRAASCIMICGWIYSIVMSSLPLFGFSNYSSTRYVNRKVSNFDSNVDIFWFSVVVLSQLYSISLETFSYELRKVHWKCTAQMTQTHKLIVLWFEH